MLPKYSFSLKPKKRRLPKAKPFTHSLGEYIRHERIKRNIKQETLAQKFGVNSVALSSWELNRKPVHPSRFKKVINFLGFIPKKSSDFDKLGSRTQLYRMQNNMTIQEFSKSVNIPIEIIEKIEQARYCKIDTETRQAITQCVSDITSCEVLS